MEAMAAARQAGRTPAFPVASAPASRPTGGNHGRGHRTGGRRNREPAGEAQLAGCRSHHPRRPRGLGLRGSETTRAALGASDVAVRPRPEKRWDLSDRRRIAGAIAPRGLRICRAPHVCVVRRFANADWAIVPVAILFVLAGRALTVYPLCLPFTWSRWTVPMQDQHILWWGGLRGALTLALVPRLSSAAFGALAVPILQPRGRAMPMSPSTTAPKCRPKKNERA